MAKRANNHQKRKSRAQERGEKVRAMPVLQPDTAGIDIHAMAMFVAVPVDRDEEPVRRFGTNTGDLLEIAAWLKRCRVKRVAMESTGVYWIPLFQILASQEFEVCVVNARHFKNVPGKKTDVADCQWLQFLHSVGLLRGSHRPTQVICAVRTLVRYRSELIGMASQHLLHMQKSLEQMNVKLHHVISDLSGVTGLAIVEAIVKGERDPQKLAKLRDKRVQASEETIIASLVGDYRREHLVTLESALKFYRSYKGNIEELDRKIEQALLELPNKNNEKQELAPRKPGRKASRNAPAFDLRQHCYRLLGVDLTEIPSMDAITAHLVVTEVGTDMGAFPSSGAFACWLGLCPMNRGSAGKILSRRTRLGKHRLGIALRVAAQTLHGSKSAMGDYFRRMKAKFGPGKAITAAAHKLARIIYHLITTQQPYDETILAKQDENLKAKQYSRLRRLARELGCDLIPRQDLPAQNFTV